MTDNMLGVNRRSYPTQRGCPGTDPMVDYVDDWSTRPPPTVAVLVAGEIGDYACYIGHGEPEWVARCGDKLSFTEAQVHFPGIEKGKYRG